MPNWKKTTWRPDTCGCEFTYQFDYDKPIGPQSPVAVSSSLCPQHAGLIGMSHQNRFNHVQDQNVRKNDVLMEAYMELGISEEGGGAMKKLRERFVDSWHMSGKDEDRVVHVVTKNMNQGQRNALQRRADNKYGSGKVVVE